MASLFHYGQTLNAELEQFSALMESGADLDSPEAQAAIASYFAAEGDFTAKAERTALYIREKQAAADAAKAEAARLTKLAKSREAWAERLKQGLLTQMQQLQKTKIDSNLCPISIRTGQWVAKVENAESLPEKYQRKTTTVEADKKALLADRDNLDIAGVTFEQAISIRIG